MSKYRQPIVVEPDDQVLGEAAVELPPGVYEGLLYFLPSHRTGSYPTTWRAKPQKPRRLSLLATH